MGETSKALLFALAFVAALIAVVLGLRRLPSRAASRPGPLGALRKAFWAAAALLLGNSVGCVGGGDSDTYVSCYVPADRGSMDVDAEADADDGGRDESTWVECYVPVDDGATDYRDLDAEADAEQTGLDADADVELPPEVDDDAGPDVAEPPDGGEPDAGEGSDVDAAPDVTEPPDGGPDAAPDAVDPYDGITCYNAARNSAEVDRRDQWARRTLQRVAVVEQLLADASTEPVVREILAADVRRLRLRARRILAS